MEKNFIFYFLEIIQNHRKQKLIQRNEIASTKKLLHYKGNNKYSEGQDKEWEKIVVKHISVKE
jgi:hypothetical protein